MNSKLLRTCGRALLGVFVVTVLAVLFPLNLQAPGWGLRLSTLIVDAASLPLVGLLLMRYAAHLEVESANSVRLQKLATGSSAPVAGGEGEPLNPFEDNQEMMRLAAAGARLKRVRQLANKGLILFILLTFWQFFLAFSNLDSITFQNQELSKQVEARFQGIEQNIKDAPQEEISRTWSQSKLKDNYGLSTIKPNPAAQRDEVLKYVRGQKLQAYQNLQVQSSTAQFNLGRNIIRIILMATIYAWAFYGIAKL